MFLFLGLPVFLAPFAGQLADRMSRRRLVVATNLVAAAGVLALGLVSGAGDVWLIYAVTFGYGFLGYVTSAAGTGLVRDLLDDDQLASGNGVLSTIDQGMRLLSPLAGAAVYAAVRRVRHRRAHRERARRRRADHGHRPRRRDTARRRRRP